MCTVTNRIRFAALIKKHKVLQCSQLYKPSHNLLHTERATAPERGQHVFTILTKLDRTGRGTKPMTDKDEPFHFFTLFLLLYPHSMKCLRSSTDSFNLLQKNVLKFKRLKKNLLLNM